MTERKAPEDLKRRGPKPKGDKLVPLNLSVRPKEKARFVKRADELGLNRHEMLVHLLNHERK